MKWSEGDRWTLTMDLPPGKHEFKVGGCWAGWRVLAEADEAMWQLHRHCAWMAGSGSFVALLHWTVGLPLHNGSHLTAAPMSLLQVAVAQGDSLVHYEDGPNRTLQVRAVEHQCCGLLCFCVS